MTSFHIQCETCNAKLKVSKASTIGQSLACPRCGQMIEVKAPEGWKPAPEKSPSTQSGKTTLPSNPRRRPTRNPIHPEDLQETMPPETSDQIQKEANKHSANRSDQTKNTHNKTSHKNTTPTRSSKPNEDPSHSSAGPMWQSDQAKKRQKTLIATFAGISIALLLGVLGYVLWGTSGDPTPNPKNNTAKNKPETDPKKPTTEQSTTQPKKNDPSTSKATGSGNKTPKTPNPSQPGNSQSTENKVAPTQTGTSQDPSKQQDGNDGAQQNDHSQQKQTQKDQPNGNGQQKKVNDGGLAQEIKNAQQGKISGDPIAKKPEVDSERSFLEILKQSQNSDKSAIRNKFGDAFDLQPGKDYSHDPASGPIPYSGFNPSTGRPNRDYKKPRRRIVNTLREFERKIPAYKTQGKTLDIVSLLDHLEKLSGVPIWLDGESFFSSSIDLNQKFSLYIKDQSVKQILTAQLPKLGLTFKKIELVRQNPEAIGILVFPMGSDKMTTRKYPIPLGIALGPAPAVKKETRKQQQTPSKSIASRADKSNTRASKFNARNTAFATGRKTAPSVSPTTLLSRPSGPALSPGFALGLVPEETEQQNQDPQKKKQDKKAQEAESNPLSNTGKPKESPVKKPEPKINSKVEKEKIQRNQVGSYLIQLIQSNVAPNTWKVNQGQGEIRIEGDEILVINTPAIQKRVARFFLQLNACLDAMKTRKLPSKEFGPRASQYGNALLKEHDISFYNKSSLKDMILQIQKETGVKILINWEAIGKDGWTPDTQVPWISKNKSLFYALDRLCFDMSLILRVVKSDVVEITSKPFAKYRMDAELYSDVGVFTEVVNWQVLSTRLKEFFREEFAEFPTASVYYDSRIGCIIARLPQKAQRKLEAYLKKQREINSKD